MRLVLISSCVMIALGCGNGGGTGDRIPSEKPALAKTPLLRLVPAAESGVTFRNLIRETFEVNITNHFNTINGGGVAVFDANNDGLPDLYFISTSGENAFYVNEGNMKFRDHTGPSGLASSGGFEMAVTAADVNGDGFLDLFVTRAGPLENDERRDRLYINNRDLTFSEQSKAYGLDDMAAAAGANFFDYDLDGDLDLYLVNYPLDVTAASRIQVRPNADSTDVEPDLDPKGPYDSDRLYRNDGPPKADGSGGFKDVSKAAGISTFGFGMSITIEDFNEDGWPDMYVAKDFLHPDYLYINNKNGTFSNRLAAYFRHTSHHTMGVDLSDFDNDTYVDLVALDMLSENEYRRKNLISTFSQNKHHSLIINNYFPGVVRNVLQRNNGNGTFSDLGCLSGIFDTDWSWSCLMVDLDNDQWKDLLVTNGYMRELNDADFINYTWAEIRKKGALEKQYARIEDFLRIIPQYKINNFVFKNNGDLTFSRQNGAWMDIYPSWSNGAAYGDLDADGDMDYVVNNIDQEAFIYENLATSQTSNRFIQLKLDGPPGNPFAVGSAATLYAEGHRQYLYLNPSRGIYSSVEHLLHFGLGNIARVDSIVIRWPSGDIQVVREPAINQRIQVKFAPTSSNRSAWPLHPPSNPLFSRLPERMIPAFAHQENDFNDFERIFLLPWALSDLGPCLASADINRDGLTDFFVGNSFDRPGGLFMQAPDGSFLPASAEVMEREKIYEDHGAHFFDADSDGDLDLAVVSGGYEAVSPQAWVPRLYLQESPGRFIPAMGALPALNSVCLRITSTDYDGDGDADLILGGRVNPGKYPLAPESYVLRNDGGKFTDVTAMVAPAFRYCGMVADVAVANLDDEPGAELVVCGEWMPILVFDIDGGKFIPRDPASLGLDKSHGFWNRIRVSDLDLDGDMDIVAGNMGLNSPYSTTSRFPIECYAHDFDKNGSIEPIITYYRDDKCYPIVQRDVLIKQWPALKKKFGAYKDYAKATITDVLSREQIAAATRLQCDVLASGWWENQEGTFVFRAFPMPAQAAPVFGLEVADLNQDGRPDVLLAGNKTLMEVETGPLDAGNGCLLLGSPSGLHYIDNRETGFWAQGEVRDLCLLQGQGYRHRIVVASNNDRLQIFENSRAAAASAVHAKK